MDYGTVSCSVAAEMTEGDRGIGAGRPCVYHIVPAGKDVYRVEQLDLTPEMEVFHMLFERCHTKNRKGSIKQHIQYFNFRSKVQLDHPVGSRRPEKKGALQHCAFCISISPSFHIQVRPPWPRLCHSLNGYLHA